VRRLQIFTAANRTMTDWPDFDFLLGKVRRQGRGVAHSVGYSAPALAQPSETAWER